MPLPQRHIALFTACIFTAVSIAAQPSPTLSNKAQAVELKVEHLAPGDKISVIPTHGQEEFGTFTSRTPENFSFYDIDQKLNVTLRYEDVKEVKDGYGGYNTLRQRHTDHKKAIIVGIALLGVLGALIIAVASSKD